MASEIRHERVLGNFKPRIRDRKKKKPSAASRREGNSERHLVLIRQLPCCVTGKVGWTDPHHLKEGLANERGMGRKATDRWAVPLCRAMHNEVERVGSRAEKIWFADHGIDALELADALWRASGDLDKMTRIVKAARK